MSKLFSPLKIRNIEFKNRIGVSPMCMYSASDGFVSDWHLVHYGKWAMGGAAMIIQEATAISPEGRISPNDVGIWSDKHIEGLKIITNFISSQNCIPAIQLAHAGRKASHASPWNGGHCLFPDAGGWQTIAPSPIRFEESDTIPKELKIEDIKELVQKFKQAAVRAVDAGFKIIEIHAAHGYLLHQFLSPLSNFRKDDYGGIFENRIRFLLEVVDEVRNNIPDSLPLFVRISATDWVDEGWDLEQSVLLAGELKLLGVDLIDVSTGGLVPNAVIPVAPGFQVPFAEKIKKNSGILTSAVGLISNAKQAEEILQNDQADLILMGREMLRNPNFPLYAAKELASEIQWPKQYLRAK